jgi:ATP-dependent protease ClpP protease subunit
MTKKAIFRPGVALMAAAVFAAFTPIEAPAADLNGLKLFMAPPEQRQRRQFYSLQSKDTEAGKVVELRIYDEIGFWGVTAKDFIDQLHAVAADAVEVVVAVNSPGGDVFDAFAIYNALRRYAGKVTARVDGVAASAASVIVMAGDTIVMPENTMMMIHNPWTIAVGTAEDMRKTAEMMDKARDGIVAAYRAKSGQKDAELIRMMDEETWMTALEAQALGFADVIEEPVKLAASIRSGELLSKFQKTPAELLAQLSLDADPPPDSEPVQTPAPAPEPEPPAAVTPEELVAHIFTTCRAAGLADLAEGIVMTTKLKDKASVDAALKDAKDIADICAAAKLPELTADYVKAGLKPEQVWARLFDKLTLESAGRISNRAPSDTDPKKVGATTSTKVYSNRRKAAGKQ